MGKFCFAVRDDDVCFYTDPKELQSVYDGIWENVTISFSVIPFAIALHKGKKIYYNAKTVFDKLQPLDKNEELIKFLREKLTHNQIEIMLHGYSHEYKEIGKKWRAECIWKDSKRLEKEITEAKKYLENTLETKIKVFVSPGNRIGIECAKIIDSLGLNLSGTLGLWGDHRPPASTDYMKAWVQYLKFLIVNKMPYPYVLNIDKHKELVAHTITPFTNWGKFLQMIEFSAQNKAPFVIATHYWELNKHPKLKQKLKMIIEIIIDKGGKPSKVSECYE